MKLFVDDIRSAPEGWILAKTITSAIEILANLPVEEVSLDHDIGCRLVTGQEHSSNETFQPVAWYLRAINFAGVVRIHTANVTGGRCMADILGIQYNNQIFNPKEYVNGN